MIQDRAIRADRPVAHHCPELTARAYSAAEPETRFAEASADLARTFAARLSGLVGGGRLRAACTAPDSLAPEELVTRVGGLAANSVLDFAAIGARALVSIPMRDLLALTDRVFGGEGEVPETLPDEMPLTADLVAAQIENLLAESFASALAPCALPEIEERAADLARLGSLATLTQCRTFALEVSEPGNAAWTILLTLCPASFAALFAASPKPVATPSGRGTVAAPFVDVPLALEAVVAEFTLPLARLSGLKPGDTIPLALSREVPLKISETTIAYGSVGAADERVALQLTRVLWPAA